MSVSISIASNNAPVAQNAVLLATQESLSNPMILNATDIDVVDFGLLQLSITSLPTKGVLVMNSANITVVPTIVTGTISYYTELRGTDQFLFVATDPRAVSASVLVPINISAINHAPSISFSGMLSALESENTTITLISASDPDGDLVKIYISALPSLGALYQVDGTRITATNTTITDSLYRVVFVPTPVMTDQVTSFSFFGNDLMGALNSITPLLSLLSYMLTDLPLLMIHWLCCLMVPATIQLLQM